MLATTLALTACGGNSNETPTTSVTPTTQSVIPKNTDTPSSTAAQAKPATQSTQINNNPFSASIDFGKESYNYQQAGYTTQLDLDGIILTNGILNTNTLPNGASTKTLTQSVYANYPDGELTKVLETKEYLYIYQQPNSIVISKQSGRLNLADEHLIGLGSELNLFYLNGNPTNSLPTTGIANYKGKAPTAQGVADFNYSVDFNKKSGKGSIVGAGYDIQLKEGNIRQVYFDTEYSNLPSEYQYGISGSASIKGTSTTGDYKLGFFGSNASEILGYLDHPDVEIGDIGFGGIKQ